MLLTYHAETIGETGLDLVVLHREYSGRASALKDAIVARDIARSVVEPIGDFAVYDGAMDLAGLGWFRSSPAEGKLDPLSLARAVVKVGDVIDDACSGRAPVVVGLGAQGGLVAVGLAWSLPDKVRAAVGIGCDVALLDRLRRADATVPFTVIAPGDAQGDDDALASEVCAWLASV